MAVETKAGWIYAVQQLEAEVASGAAVPAATTTTAGKVKQITFTPQQSPAFADLTAVTTAYNALLTKLIAAGIMPAS
ncbi:MAG: head fiber protein [Myoviridae sp. ctThM1]|nr:MAG: head fiber protein [Myoviridae sp. ctThM1]